MQLQWRTVPALALLLAPWTAPTPASEGCLLGSPPHIVHDEVGSLLQFWIEKDRPALREAIIPASPSLEQFRERIGRAFDTDPRILMERHIPHASGGDAENLRIVLAGRAGTVRPMSCLEALLLAEQTDRSIAQGRSMYSHPTEFASYVLKRADTLKIWFYTVDQPGIRGLSSLHEPLFRDLQQGWAVVVTIHNHNFFPEADALMGVIAPSATDVQYLRSMQESLELPLASITNGFHSLDVPAADFQRFRSDH